MLTGPGQGLGSRSYTQEDSKVTRAIRPSSVKQHGKEDWWLKADGSGVAIDARIGSEGRTQIRRETWESISHIRMTQAGDRASIGSLVAFGVLAIGSRIKHNAIIASLGEGPAVFLLDRLGPEQVHAIAEGFRMAGAPPAKVLIGDVPLGSAPPTDTDDLVTALERLVELTEKGRLTPDEYQIAKDLVLKRTRPTTRATTNARSARPVE